MRAGDCSLPWEPELVSPCFTFYSIGQGRAVCFGCCLGVWFALFFIVPDLSFWSRCPTMTILAQLNDCHSCNDARSIVQKKKEIRSIQEFNGHPRSPLGQLGWELDCLARTAPLCSLWNLLGESVFSYLSFFFTISSFTFNLQYEMVCTVPLAVSRPLFFVWAPLFTLKVTGCCDLAALAGQFHISYQHD